MPEENELPSAAPDTPRRRGAVSAAPFLIMTVALVVYVFVIRPGTLWRDNSGVTRDFQVMNTYARITVPEPGGSGLTPAELADLAEQAVREVDRLMSPFGEGSDVRRLNETPAGVWIEVHPLTWHVVLEALRWHRLTDGAFDPTIGPLKRLFVFDQSEADAWPDDGKMAEARKRVGAEKLRFEREGMRLSWTTDGMRLDLGAIAKGYSADLAAEALVRQGVRNALVDVGGELRIIGGKPGNPPTPWKLGIKNPRDANEVVETLFLPDPAATTGDLSADVGVATSGDYERYFMYEGKRYEHIIDPRIGMPLTGGAASVTVLYPGSCLAADALATSLCVLGPDEGREFIRSQSLGAFSSGVRVVMLIPEENGTLRRLEFRVDDKGGFSETESFVKANG